MPAAIILSVYALAVARVTRIITADKITEGLRGRVIRWADRRAGIDPADPFAPTPLLSYFVTCPWCVSIYVGAVAAPLAYWWGESPWLLVPAFALAFSAVTGYLASIGEE